MVIAPDRLRPSWKLEIRRRSEGMNRVNRKMTIAAPLLAVFIVAAFPQAPNAFDPERLILSKRQGGSPSSSGTCSRKGTPGSIAIRHQTCSKEL